MTNIPDEAKLKELVKSAVVEALAERQDLITKPAVSHSSSRVIRTIAIWVLILVTAIGLYNLVAVSARP